jgi:MSHA biogenesis protein MshQ
VVERAIQITTRDFRSRRACARVSGVADPFNGHIDEFRISHVQRSDAWIETTWNNMSNPGAFAGAAAEEQEGGEPPPLAGAGVVVCLMG